MNWDLIRGIIVIACIIILFAIFAHSMHEQLMLTRKIQLAEDKIKEQELKRMEE